MDIWRPTTVEAGRCLHWRVGLLDIWVERADGEWLSAFRHNTEPFDVAKEEDEKRTDTPPAVAEPCERPADVVWRRTVVDGDAALCKLAPTMPDRPVVIRPEQPLTIPPRRSSIFYMSVPVRIRATAGDADPVVLMEEPSVVLSNTWFGEVTAGVLCYAVRTRARREADARLARPHRAVCRVEIANVASTPLDFQRLCVHVEALDIFDGRDQLWTNRLKVEYRGEDQPAHIQVAGGPPPEEGVGELLTKAPRPAPKGLMNRVFSRPSA